MRKQNNRILSLAVLLFSALSYLGCGDGSMTDPKEYQTWLNDPGNGLVQTRNIGGLKLTVKYLPPEYLAHRELMALDNPAGARGDSITGTYRGSSNFMVTIAPEERGEGDVMMRGVRSYQDFAQRTMTLNFEMAQHITLVVDGKTYTPALTAPDNDYGMTTARSIVFAFNLPSDALSKARTIDFVFSDGVFETGISHFTFTPDDIRNRPTFTF